MSIQEVDTKLINFSKRFLVPFIRFSLFLLFFWFGLLKVLGLSPVADLVQQLFEQTIHFMSFNQFIILFGLFECLIGILFIIPNFERVALALLFFHMLTTFMPLFILPEVAWSSFLVPTLEGQYIFKNLAIIAGAIGIFAHLKPLSEHSNQ